MCGGELSACVFCKYSADNCRRFAQRMHERPGIEVTTTDSPEDTVRDPCPECGVAQPCMHVAALTTCEFDPTVAPRPQRVC